MRTFTVAIVSTALTTYQALARRTVADEGAHVALASNLELAARAEVEWEAKESRFCIEHEVQLICDEYSVIAVRTGFYNRAAQDITSGQTCTPFAGGSEPGCRVSNKDMLKAKCDGKRSCQIKPEDHRSCSEHPFTFMRVRYECESAPPADDTPEVADALEEVQQTASGKDVPPEIVGVPEPVLEPPSKPVYLKSRPQLDTSSGDIKTVKTPVEAHLMDDLKPVEVKGVKGVKVQKAIKKQAQLHETIELTPCYRLDRFTLAYRWDALSRLTSCGEYEGCFKLLFPGGKVHSDENVIPTNDEILNSELSEGSDSLLVTWKGIKLQRNDYWTWGLCLPKTEGLQVAMETFKSLKALKGT